MDWSQIFTIIAANIAVCLWSRGEAVVDYLSLKQRIEEIQEDMKVFHGKLCALEKRKNHDK